MESVPVAVDDVGGGMVDGVPPVALRDNQCERLVNWFPFTTKLSPRRGVQRASVTPAASPITGLLTFATASSKVTVAGTEAGFEYNNGGAMTPIPAATPLASRTKPWSMVQYKDEIYAIRPGERLQRLTLASSSDAGVPAPTTAPAEPAIVAPVAAIGPTIGAAGLVEPGDYDYFATFDTATQRSKPSPMASITVLVPSIVDIIGSIPVSADPNVTTVSVWRTKKDEPEKFFLVLQVPNGTVTSGDNVPDSAVGESYGPISPGQYTYFVTFVTSTGNESPEGPAAVVTQSVYGRAYLSLPTSTLPRVVARRLWRSGPDDPGQLYEVDFIADNVTTEFLDLVSNDELGEPFGYNNGLPPADPGYSIASWNQRLWWTDGKVLSATNPGQFETFDQSFRNLDEFTGHVIRALHPWDQRLMVGTTSQVKYITQTGVDESGIRFDVDTLSSDHGCVSHHSMKSAEGRLFWFAGDNVYMSEGGHPIAISAVAIPKLLKTMRSDRWEYAIGAVDTQRGWYVLAISIDSANNNDTVLVYDYRNQRWAQFRYFTSWVAPAALLQSYDDSFQTIPLCAFRDGHIYEMETTGRDHNDPIRFLAKSRAFQRWRSEAILRRFEVNCSSVPGNMTARLYRDVGSELVAINERDFSLNQTRDWKRVALAGFGPDVTAVPRLKARSFQVEFEYAGEQAVEINQFLLDVDTFEYLKRPL